MKKFLLILVLAAVVLSLTGCMPGDGKHTAEKPAGFFWGIWHGWIALISLIRGLFNSGIRIYETNNTGWWYDFGYFLAIVGGFGSLSLTRRARKSQKH